MRFSQGDTVRIDITDKGDPDFKHHQETGEVLEIIGDDTEEMTSDKRDCVLYLWSLY